MPDIEAIAEMRQTAADLRATSNGNCNAVWQAIMWDRKANDLEKASPVSATEGK